MKSEIIRVEEGQLIIVENAIENIKKLEQQKKLIDAKEKEFKANLAKIMQENGITGYESNDKTLKISYTPDTDYTTFDSTTFQKENPDMYRKYLKDSFRKGIVRITVRENKNEINDK